MKTISAIAFASVSLLVFGGQARAGVASICDADPNNLVVNCGFETGAFTAWTLSGPDVPGEEGNLYGVEGTDPVDGIAPNSGNFQAYIADLVNNATTLSQTLSTNVGDDYSISFYLAQDTAPAGGYTNSLSVGFGSDTLISQTGLPVSGYSQYSFTDAASSASTMLDITLGNDLGEFLLDDVQVDDLGPAAAPEPATGLLLLGSGLLLTAAKTLRRPR